MYQHISPREELIKQAKELRKSIYKIDEAMHDKMPKKREGTGLLEDQIEYTKELLNLVKEDARFTTIPNIKEKINLLEETMMDTEYEIEYSKDKDAKVGHKTADTSFFGYKAHIAMTPERIITAATITTGEKHDGKQLQKLVEKSQANGIEVEAVIGDGAYSEKENIEYCEEKEIKLASKLSKCVTHGDRKKEEEFEYNKDAGMYVCKAGHMAIYKRKHGSKVNKDGYDNRVEAYYFDIEKCKHCPYKNGCYKEGAKSKTYNVKIKDNIHIKHMDYMRTEEFKNLYSERYKIEAKNSELKSNFGYDKANACGKNGITIQGASALFLATEKSKVTRPTKTKYLSFSFWKDTKGKWKPKPHIKAYQKLKRKLKALTKRNWSISLDYRIKQINYLVKGWGNYFRIANMKNAIQEIDEHLRTRIRVIIWKQWKKPQRKEKALKQLGVKPDIAYGLSHTSKGYQLVAKTDWVKFAINNERLRKRGLIFLSDQYAKVHVEI